MLVLVDHPSTTGGGERLAVQTAARLDHSRFETTLCATRWHPRDAADPVVAPALDELRSAGVRFDGLERSSRRDLAPWASLAQSLRGGRIDVLHTHKFGSNVWGGLLGRAVRVPVIVAHEHTWSYEGWPLRRGLDRHVVARGADAFLAVSHEDARRMAEVEHVDPRDVLVVPNGIPPPRLPRAGAVRRELGIPPDAPVIGTAARLSRQKAPGVLVRAAARLRGEFPHLRVLIAGAGREEAAVRALIRELGLEDTVLLLGARTDVPDVLAALDVAVCASRWEGSPLSVMEYMASGLPIVATAVGGVPDLIEPGVHGVLVAPGDPVALADAVAGLLRDPAAARAMGRRARERQRREFDLGVTVQRLERLYDDLLAARHDGRRRAASRRVLASHRASYPPAGRR